MKTSKSAIAISLLIIALGIGWLLNKLQVFGGQIDWIWVSALGVSGVLLLTLSKLDRFNFVVGVSFILCAILAVLKYLGVVQIDLVAPILFTSVGVLLLLAHLFRIPGASGQNDQPTPPSDPHL